MSSNPDIRGCTGLMLQELLTGPATLAQLVACSGLKDRTVYRWLAVWHGRLRVLRICGWEPDATGKPMPVYGLNHEHKPDVKRPPKRTEVERQAARRLRLLAAPQQRAPQPNLNDAGVWYGTGSPVPYKDPHWL